MISEEPAKNNKCIYEMKAKSSLFIVATTEGRLNIRAYCL
jgi:hypothetical protein